MSAFTGPLTLTHLDADWRRWRLESKLRFTTGDSESGLVIDVPIGFVTDGASVPRPLWALLPAWGRYSRAVVVHDYLCRLIKDGTPHQTAPDRKTADAIFYEAMVVCGVNRVVRWVMWAAVRVASWLA
jgi:Protein of unknown function (DUF1353)